MNSKNLASISGWSAVYMFRTKRCQVTTAYSKLFQTHYSFDLKYASNGTHNFQIFSCAYLHDSVKYYSRGNPQPSAWADLTTGEARTCTGRVTFISFDLAYNYIYRLCTKDITQENTALIHIQRRSPCPYDWASAAGPSRFTIYTINCMYNNQLSPPPARLYIKCSLRNQHGTTTGRLCNPTDIYTDWEHETLH